MKKEQPNLEPDLDIDSELLYTALILASENGEIEMSQLLLEDLSSKISQNEKIYVLKTSEKTHPQFRDLLLQKCITEVSENSRDNDTTFVCVLDKRYIDIMKLFKMIGAKRHFV